MFEFIKKYLFLFIIGLIVLVILVITMDKQDMEQAEDVLIEESFVSKEGVEQEDNSFAMVDLKGEVNKPGVYKLEAHDRVKDVIQLAGGFTDEADETSVNLAQKVQDEMVIIVTEIGASNEGATSESQQNEKVSVNVATEAELVTLNGIGSSKAQAIISYREENGMFRSVDDLLEVNGIGEKTLDKIRDDIKVP